MDKGLDVGVLLAEGLDIPADWAEFDAGEGVVQRVGARRGSPSGCGRGPKDPKCEQVMGEDDFGGLARVVAVCLQDDRRSAVHFREELLEGCGGGEDVEWEGKEGVLERQVRLRKDSPGDLEDGNPCSDIEPVDRRADEWVEGV